MLSILMMIGAHAHEPCVVPEGALLPDMWSVVPSKLQLWDQQQGETLRFSNGMSNLGEGLWWMEPSDLNADPVINPMQQAYQVFSNSTTVTAALPPASADPGYLGRCEVGEFDFHPEHNHWHIAQVAEYRVCAEADFLAAKAAGVPETCTAAAAPSSKVTFCLIDWIKLDGNTNNGDGTRNFFACETSFQGITPGWTDQYHHSLPDQELSLTGIPDGRYVLVTTVNRDDIFIETDTSNNTSWTTFDLLPQGNGNRSVTVVEDACNDAGYLADLQATIAAMYSDPVARAEVQIKMCGGAKPNR